MYTWARGDMMHAGLGRAPGQAQPGPAPGAMRTAARQQLRIPRSAHPSVPWPWPWPETGQARVHPVATCTSVPKSCEPRVHDNSPRDHPSTSSRVACTVTPRSAKTCLHTSRAKRQAPTLYTARRAQHAHHTHNQVRARARAAASTSHKAQSRSAPTIERQGPARLALER